MISCDGAEGHGEERGETNRSYSYEIILTHFLFPPLARIACLGSSLPFVRVDFGASHGDCSVMSFWDDCDSPQGLARSGCGSGSGGWRVASAGLDAFARLLWFVELLRVLDVVIDWV
jgi:hypothetical protein